MCPITNVDIDVCKEDCTFRSPYPCDRDVHELCCILMAENHVELSADPFDSVNLYMFLRDNILRNL